MSQNSSQRLNNDYIKIHQSIKNINSSSPSYKKPIPKINLNCNLIQKKETGSVWNKVQEKLLNKNSQLIISKKSSSDVDNNKQFSSEKKEHEYKLEKEKQLKHNKVFIHGNDNKNSNLSKNIKTEKIKNQNNEKVLSLVSKDDKATKAFDKLMLEKINLIQNDLLKQSNDFSDFIKDKKNADEKLIKIIREVEQNIIKENKENNKVITKENIEEMTKQYFYKFDNLKNDISEIKNYLTILLGSKREREENDNLKKEKNQKNIFENETINDSNFLNQNSPNEVEIKKELDYGKMIDIIENEFSPYVTNNDLINFFPNDNFYSNYPNYQSQIETQIHNQSDFVNKIELQSDNQIDVDNKIILQSDMQIDNKIEIGKTKEKNKDNKNPNLKSNKFEIEFQKYFKKIENNNSLFYGIPYDSTINFLNNNTIDYPNLDVNKQFFILGKDILNFDEDFKYEFILQKIGIGISIGIVNINLTIKNNFKIQLVQNKCSILLATSSRIFNYLDNSYNKVSSKNKKDFEKIILEYNSLKKNLKFESPGHFVNTINLNLDIIKNEEFRIGVFLRGKNTLVTVNKI